MDTDGSLSSHPSSKIMIYISITSDSLRKSVVAGLKDLGLNGGEFNKGIMIYGKNKIDTFYKIFGFSNLKNLLKYDYFLKNSIVPSSKEVETFIMAKKDIK
jgi:hypothetical protein